MGTSNYQLLLVYYQPSRRRKKWDNYSFLLNAKKNFMQIIPFGLFNVSMIYDILYLCANRYERHVFSEELNQRGKRRKKN